MLQYFRTEQKEIYDKLIQEINLAKYKFDKISSVHC